MRQFLPLCLLAPVALAACGSGPAGPASAANAHANTATASGSTVTAATPVPDDAQPAGRLTRAQVHRAVSRGLGRFLQNVSVEDRPIMTDGKFKGFRIAGLDGNYFRGVDLQPGDVVMRVNGFSIERPEGALEAFRSLEVASELRVELERGGAPRELRFAIVDDAAPSVATPAAAPASSSASPSATSLNVRSR